MTGHLPSLTVRKGTNKDFLKELTHALSPKGQKSCPRYMGHLTHLMNWITSIRGASYFSHFTVRLVGGSWIASPTATPSYDGQLSVVCALDLLLTCSALSLSVSLPPPCAGCWCRQGWRLPVRKERGAVKCSTPAICFWLQVAVWGCLL